MSAVSQPGEESLSGCCPLSSPGAAADRQLLLWTEMLNIGHHTVEGCWSHELNAGVPGEKLGFGEWGLGAGCPGGVSM